MYYNTENREIFSQQIAEILDKKQLLKLVKALQTAKELKNIIAINGYENLGKLADSQVLNSLLIEAQHRLDNLNLLENIGTSAETKALLNSALEDIVFQFVKIGEEELKLADEYKEQLRKTREVMLQNFDQTDLEFVSLKEELERIFKKKNLAEVTQEDLRENMPLLRKIEQEAKEINRKNDLLKAKYDNDEMYVRLHKRLREKENELSVKEMKLMRALQQVKKEVDEKLENQADVLENEAFFSRYLTKLVLDSFKNKEKFDFGASTIQNISYLINKEYNQFYTNR